MIASIQQEENDLFLPEMSLKPPVEFGSKELLEKFLHDQLASVSDDEEQLSLNQSPNTTRPLWRHSSKFAHIVKGLLHPQPAQ